MALFVLSEGVMLCENRNEAKRTDNGFSEKLIALIVNVHTINVAA